MSNEHMFDPTVKLRSMQPHNGLLSMAAARKTQVRFKPTHARSMHTHTHTHTLPGCWVGTQLGQRVCCVVCIVQGKGDCGRPPVRVCECGLRRGWRRVGGGGGGVGSGSGVGSG